MSKKLTRVTKKTAGNNALPHHRDNCNTMRKIRKRPGLTPVPRLRELNF
jgi:hypothetical protein